ncbi:hypothetical protein CONPUDRAFT_32187, partial [Coniophora puteana RWD-64-598 SS2]
MTSTIPVAYTIAFTAPEVLEYASSGRPGHSKHTPMSDMFSFGGLCHEPSPRSRSSAEELNDGMWDLMKRCWARDPSERPTAMLVVQFLE